MASSPVARPCRQPEAALADLLDKPKPTAETVLSPIARNGKDLEFDEIDVVLLFETKNYNFLMRVDKRQIC